jgi:NADH-quinone oxidoreductase subunit N
MPFSYSDLYGISPILIVSVTALLALCVKALWKNSENAIFFMANAGIIAAMVLAVTTFAPSTTAFGGMVLVGGYASFFDILFLLCGLMTLLLSESYLRKEGIFFGEYYVLILFALAGMMMMGSAGDLIIVFLGIELMSVCFYVLAGFRRTTEHSNEAALKYFLLGAFATGFLLYGIALVYGTAGTTNLVQIAAQYSTLVSAPWTIVGFGLLLIGFAFKVAAVPFHMWVPDVYEGSPTTVTAFMSTGGKAAAFAAFILVFSIPMAVGFERFAMLIAILAAASMIVGNLFGLAQTNLKRMLAYSSIAHAGYMLVGMASGLSIGLQGVLFYLLSYGFTNLGAFGVVSIIEGEHEGNLSYEQYAGLGSRKPLLAGLLSVFLFSLTGLPPFSGFVGKYYLFESAVQSHFTWLAILGVLTSLISAYYYLRVVVYMYFKDSDQPGTVSVPGFAMLSLVISGIGIVVLGIFPSIALNITRLFL